MTLATLSIVLACLASLAAIIGWIWRGVRRVKEIRKEHGND